MSKVNLKDLAKALNISVSTVSKALRDSYEIGDETKKKVIAKAQSMGYSPNPYAGFLRNCLVLKKVDYKIKLYATVNDPH